MAINRPKNNPDGTPNRKKPRKRTPSEKKSEEVRLHLALDAEGVKFLEEVRTLWRLPDKGAALLKILGDYRRGFPSGQLEISLSDRTPPETLDRLARVAEGVGETEDYIRRLESLSNQELLTLQRRKLLRSSEKMSAISEGMLEMCVATVKRESEKTKDPDYDPIKIHRVPDTVRSLGAILKDANEAQLKAHGIDVLMQERNFYAGVCDRLVLAVFGTSSPPQNRRAQLEQVVAHIEKLTNPNKETEVEDGITEVSISDLEVIEDGES